MASIQNASYHDQRSEITILLLLLLLLPPLLLTIAVVVLVVVVKISDVPYVTFKALSANKNMTSNPTNRPLHCDHKP